LTQGLQCINNNFLLITSGDRLFSTPFAFIKYLLTLQVLYSRTVLYHSVMKVALPNGNTYSLRRNPKSCKIGVTSERICIVQLDASIEQMNISYSLAMTNRHIILSFLMFCMHEFPSQCCSV